MRSQRRVGTAPELLLRSILHAAGLRYRVGFRIPGLARRTIDIAFVGPGLAIFVDGCFWHQCPLHSVPVKNNSEWWRHKLQANVDRDRDTDRHLAAIGWKVLRFWEHDDPEQAAEAIVRVLEDLRAGQ